LTDGTSTYTLRLARWEPQPYQRHYVPAISERGDIPGSDAENVPLPRIRRWHIDAWSGGEGEDLWVETYGAFHESNNVRLVFQGEGIELGAYQEVTVKGDDSAFNEGRRLGLGQGKLFAVDDGDAWRLNPNTGKWNTTSFSTGAGASNATSVVDGDINDTWMYSGHETGAIWRWKSGSSEEHYAAAAATPFTDKPVLWSQEGIIFALDGNDLYTIDQTATDTRTLVSDTAANPTRWTTYLGYEVSYNRLSGSDVGPIWLVVGDNGQTILKEYNIGSDTTKIVGKLPMDFATPYSVMFAKGWYWVGFRYAPDLTEPGDAYVWAKRGNQETVIGPLRTTSGRKSNGGTNVLLCGVLGDDVIVWYDNAVWAYRTSTGGLYMVARQTSSTAGLCGIVFGKDIYLSAVTNGANTMSVERLVTTDYTTQTNARIDTGRYDFDLPGITKLLLKVHAETLPLPTNTTLKMAYSTDGGNSFTTHGTTITGDDAATSHTWTVSAVSGPTNVTFKELEIRMLLLTTSSTATPTLRSVTVEALPIEREVLVELLLDAGTAETGANTADQTLADLATIAGTDKLWTFSDPWLVRDATAAETMDVMIERLSIPDESAGEQATARMLLRARDTV